MHGDMDQKERDVIMREFSPAPLVSSSPPTCWPEVSTSSRSPWSSTTTSPPTEKTTSTESEEEADLVVRELRSTLLRTRTSDHYRILRSFTTHRLTRCP